MNIFSMKFYSEHCSTVADIEQDKQMYKLGMFKTRINNISTSTEYPKWSWQTELLFSHFNEHAGHTRKALRISKTVVENCGKGVGNF